MSEHAKRKIQISDPDQIKEIKGHQLASRRDNKISKKSAHANQKRKRNREHVAQSSLKTKSFFEKQHRHAKITTDVQRRTRERTLQLTPQMRGFVRHDRHQNSSTKVTKLSAKGNNSINKTVLLKRLREGND
ncbi:hypothetical protein P8452_46989 [Trifolium repens]|nr:hypothetical protein P8452_46989 [Trifolium repens]